jgi:hypothetical protein
MGVAGDRIRLLADHIGVGQLEGNVEVNQVYAHYQHEGADFKHPRGGQAFYLQEPLYESTDRYVQSVANDLLDVEKSLVDTVFDVTQDLVKQVEVRAPVEFTNLRRSGHATVSDNGGVVRDQPPEQHRLSEQELKALSKARGGHKYGR